MEILKNRKPVYLFDLDGNLIKKFVSTHEFSDFCGYDNTYIYHNLKYCKRIRIKGQWYVIKRKEDNDE